MLQGRNRRNPGKPAKLRIAQGTATAIAIASVLFFSASHSAPGDLLGGKAPDFVLRSVADGNVRLSEYRSDVVVLNFWSDWCGSCNQLLPALNELRARHESAGLRVLAVDVKGEARSASNTAKELHLELPLLLDEHQQVSRTYDLPRLPVTLLIDREGTVRFVQQGATSEVIARLTDEVAAVIAE